MTYRPLLRWKRGEQNALANLTAAHKREVRPLLTLTGHSYDPPEGHSVDAAFDARILQDAQRLSAAWAGYRASIDLGSVDPEAECENGQHPLTVFFGAVEDTVDARPVLRASSDARFVDAVAEIGVSPTFRLTPDDLADPNIADLLRDQLETCELSPNSCDVVVDLGYIAAVGRSVLTARGALAALPFSADWESVTLASGSFPENLTQFAVGAHTVERVEWEVWQSLSNSGGRSISYGDYTTIHPNPVEEGLDPRTMNPSASVRYTYEDTWLLLRGEGTRNPGGRGFAQFQDHANNLVRRPEYRGEAFSFGDERIARIAREEDRPGNLETWITIGVNHHIAEIVGQLATQL